MKNFLRSGGGVALLMTFALLPSACHESRQPPYLNKFLVVASPSGMYEATLYNFGDGGSGFLSATVSTPMYVGVRRRDRPFHPKRGQVLAMMHGYRARLTWETDTRLRIEYMAEAAIRHRETQMEGVTLRSVPARSPLPEHYEAEPFAYKP